MGRHYKESLSYFPFYSDFFEDDDIKSLRREHGTVGILTWLYILCEARGKHGYYFEFKSIKELAQDITEKITNNHHGRVTSLVLESISYLIDVHLIDSDAVEQRLITGRKIQEKYVEIMYKARRSIKLDVHPLVDVSIVIANLRKNDAEKSISATEKSISATEMQQRVKSKYKRENNTLSYAHPRGKNQNVYLTDEEYEDICEKIQEADAYIDRFSEKLDKCGYTYSDHHATILSWWQSDKKRFQQAKTTEQRGSFDTDEFFKAAVSKQFKDVKE